VTAISSYKLFRLPWSLEGAGLGMDERERERERERGLKDVLTSHCTTEYAWIFSRWHQTTWR